MDGLSEQEVAACLIAERSLGVTAEPWDVLGRQGVVDAMLTYPDGRRAAFEVTSLAAHRALHTDSLLRTDDHRWPLPGHWWWSITVGSPSDLLRLRAVYPAIIRLCESANVGDPAALARYPNANSDLRWLVTESSSEMKGHPNVSARTETGAPRQATIRPPAGDGVVDAALAHLDSALKRAFDDSEHIRTHFEKLARTHAQEHHLFLALHDSALPSSELLALMSGDSLPPSSPPVPDFLSHLWIAPPYSPRVLLWVRRQGWRSFHPYDEPGNLSR